LINGWEEAKEGEETYNDDWDTHKLEQPPALLVVFLRHLHLPSREPVHPTIVPTSFASASSSLASSFLASLELFQLYRGSLPPHCSKRLFICLCWALDVDIEERTGVGDGDGDDDDEGQMKRENARCRDRLGYGEEVSVPSSRQKGERARK
jgi:hypothetical protein